VPVKGKKKEKLTHHNCVYYYFFITYIFADSKIRSNVPVKEKTKKRKN